ncbi:LysR family transcriptional regulator [Photobacterium sp. R1]
MKTGIKRSQHVTLKMLRYFREVAQSGHFTQAAERLNITKSPLSAQIKALESLLGVALFERDTRNVTLTAEGKQLWQECVRIFDTIDVSLNRVQQVGRAQASTLNIGLMSSVFWAGFGEAIRAFQQQYPEIRIQLLEMAPKKQKQALANHSIDIGLVRYADTLHCDPLGVKSVFREEMLVVVSDQHPLKSRKAISVRELSEEAFVLLHQENSASSQYMMDLCNAQGVSLSIHQQVVEPNTLMAIVSASPYISIVPASYRNHPWPHVCFISLKESISADICALLPDAGPSPSAMLFLDTVSAFLTETQ